MRGTHTMQTAALLAREISIRAPTHRLYTFILDAARTSFMSCRGNYRPKIKSFLRVTQMDAGQPIRKSNFRVFRCKSVYFLVINMHE